MVKFTISLVSLLLSPVLYVYSLFLPAFIFRKEVLLGLDILQLGWWGILTGNPCWYANPAFFATYVLLLLRKYHMAHVLGVAAFLLALLSLLTDEWYFNEAYATEIESFGPGVYVWLISIGMVTLTSYLYRKEAA